MRLVAIGVLGLGALELLLSGCAGAGVLSSFNDETTIEEPISTLRLDGVAGDVTVRIGDTARVERVVRYDEQRPGVTHAVRGGTLTLGRCPLSDCWLSYEVTVPKGTAVTGSVHSGDISLTEPGEVRLTTEAGSVRAERVDGPVRVESAAGDVTVDGADGPVSVRATAGSIRLTDVVGDIDAQTESGDVRGERLAGAAFTASTTSGSVRLALTDPRQVRANVQSGDIDLDVPRGPYQVEATVDSGATSIEVDTSERARRSLELAAGSGQITVR
ncbi:putative adhesin [Tamaricihabitans halophyticus]|uniref:Putative adhesin n=1 Tax=Tamaricihabitans halophyticus TaxID=1262583 RepID=A0A4R2RC15_9PSEU|nr:DUF4097 family beta strand repeat-containing protein [Tamaricihabitans halophyticus]TCP57261.1 putative adhesin [Tamaricihabitans halophyticus]